MRSVDLRSLAVRGVDQAEILLKLQLRHSFSSDGFDTETEGYSVIWSRDTSPALPPEFITRT